MLQKQTLPINFTQGLDTKTDPFQVQAGKFLSLQNSIFDKAGRLTKRNGYNQLASLPDATSKYLTTFNGNLTTLGNKLEAYSAGTQQWVNKGAIQPIDLTTIPAVRSASYQGQADSVTAANGLACVVYTDYIPSGGTVTPAYKYAVLDSTTGQYIANPTLIPNADTTYGTPRVFLLGAYFVIVYTTHPGTYHLQYIAISTQNPANVTAPNDIASSYVPSTTLAFDGIVLNESLFLAYSTAAGGQSIKVTYLKSTLGNPVTANTFAGEIATMFTLAIDKSNITTPVVYVAYYDLPSTTSKVLAVSATLGTILAPTTISTTGTLLNLASTAQNGSVQVLAEVSNNYGYDPGIPTHYIKSTNITQTGTVGTPTVMARSVGLASKAFLFNGTSYVLSVYDSDFQPSYFLLNDSGQVISKLAYTNSGPYLTLGLPNITINASLVTIPYLYKDLIQSVNKSQGFANPGGVYAQLGINLVTFNFDATSIVTAEIGQNLNFTGGFLSMYDGVAPVEQNFFVYPDSVETAPMTTGGSMADQTYFYQVTYEWSDNQGNVFRSAPSIPVSVIISGGSGSGSALVYVPTLRLTYKINNPVKIVIYRWSTAQQSYYQTTSLLAPILNNSAVDAITFTDTNSDAAILGNNLIYTTGGVIEDLSPPATDLITLFNNRLWLVDAEDRNLLWFSKQVIEATPVEMSDLLTLYVAPSTASEGSTGPITAMAPMDDKLIIFKSNALGYVSGIGPDNTGANNQYSDFTLINSVVGCTNQQSIVFMPQGLMFQSNKGIWLIGRDLSTNYIGAPVESLTTGATVLSALNVPSTNQVRFTLDTGITLLYDYYYNQWGTFVNIPALSSTIYESLHTYINSFGQVFQESPGLYLDGSSPVLMSFTTSWLNLAGVQGFERFYHMYLLGQYLSPFKLNVQLAYDYNPSPVQATLVTPSQVPVSWGSAPLWGSGTSWGGVDNIGWEGQANVFEARLFPQRQKCEAFQITINEIYDGSVGGTAGAGLTLTGLNIVMGMKRGFRTSKASRNFG